MYIHLSAIRTTSNGEPTTRMRCIIKVVMQEIGWATGAVSVPSAWLSRGTSADRHKSLEHSKDGAHYNCRNVKWLQATFRRSLIHWWTEVCLVGLVSATVRCQAGGQRSRASSLSQIEFTHRRMTPTLCCDIRLIASEFNATET
jgi:hypothetical protein